MRRLLVVAALTLIVACEPTTEGDPAPSSLTGVWSWVDFEEVPSTADSVIVTDNDDTLEMVRCGRQDLLPEVWSRDGDALAPPDDSRVDGAVVDAERLESPDDDPQASERFGWLACKADGETRFHAGSLTVAEGLNPIVDTQQDVCASRGGESADQITVATWIDEELTLVRFALDASGDVDELRPVELRIDGAGMDLTPVDQAAFVADVNTPGELAGSFQGTVVLDGGFRTFIWDLHVRFDPVDCD